MASVRQCDTRHPPACTWHRSGRYPETEPLLLAAHEAHRAAGGADGPRTAQAAAALVGLYEA